MGAVAGGGLCEIDRGTLVAEPAAPGGSISPVLVGLVGVSLRAFAGSALVMSSPDFIGSGTVAIEVPAAGAPGAVSTVLAIEVVDDMASLALPRVAVCERLTEGLSDTRTNEVVESDRR